MQHRVEEGAWTHDTVGDVAQCSCGWGSGEGGTEVHGVAPTSAALGVCVLQQLDMTVIIYSNDKEIPPLSRGGSK